MKKPSWRHMRESLRERHGAPPPMRAEDFWALARPRLANCRTPGTPVAAPLSFWIRYRKWTLAAAAALLFSAGLVVVERQGRTGGTGQRAGLSALERVDVWVDYHDVLVVNSARHRGTVVWVSGLDDRSEAH